MDIYFLFCNILVAVWKKEFWSAVPALALYYKWFLGGKQVPMQTSKLDYFVSGHLKIFILQQRESITEMSKSQREKLLLKSFSESFAFILGKWKCAQWLHRAEQLLDTGLLASLKKTESLGRQEVGKQDLAFLFLDIYGLYKCQRPDNWLLLAIAWTVLQCV